MRTIEPTSEETKPTAHLPRYVTKRQLARVLGCSTRWIEKAVAAKKIPVLRLGRRLIRFELARVTQALNRFEVRAVGE